MGQKKCLFYQCANYLLHCIMLKKIQYVKQLIVKVGTMTKVPPISKEVDSKEQHNFRDILERTTTLNKVNMLEKLSHEPGSWSLL